ncbi:MAG: adenylate/guanylate cyclase domain-containing response regulator [Pseudomonadota bacterium]
MEHATRNKAPSGSTSRSLRDAISGVAQVASSELERLNEEMRQDWNALQACAERLSPLLDEPGSDPHELRNLVGAFRGYAEMIGEALETSLPELEQALTGVIRGTDEVMAEAQNLEPIADTHQITLEVDPGFILAVDDREENRELLARYLTRSGHFVMTAPNGEQALELLGNSDVDVVLLDRRMPGMDGKEVLQRIKTDARSRATPVIMISGEQDLKGIIDCIEAGADDYLFKPFNPILLQARIKAGIERKRWHDKESQYRDQLERNERFIRATFGRYLSDDIVTEILERPEGLELGGDLREVTILMSDIRGFTTLSEQLEPNRVVSMLNRYLGAMCDIILEYGGTIDEFLGDAILAVFGAPKRHNDDADRAVRCSLAMQAAMRDINAANQEDELPVLAMGVALNTGKVIAGNIGSERRSKYGFVGHAMNVTSRIEDVTAGGEVLIADSTRNALGAAYRFGDARQISAPGIDEVLVAHPVLKELL